MEVIMVILFYKCNDVVVMKKKKEGENLLSECILE